LIKGLNIGIIKKALRY